MKQPIAPKAMPGNMAETVRGVHKLVFAKLPPRHIIPSTPPFTHTRTTGIWLLSASSEMGFYGLNFDVSLSILLHADVEDILRCERVSRLVEISDLGLLMSYRCAKPYVQSWRASGYGSPNTDACTTPVGPRFHHMCLWNRFRTNRSVTLLSARCVAIDMWWRAMRITILSRV